jgi:hypothetical protein
VLATHCGMYGVDASGWPAGALASLRRRHEWLLTAIAQRVGAVPAAAYYPLGRASRRLLNPGRRGVASGLLNPPGGLV